MNCCRQAQWARRAAIFVLLIFASALMAETPQRVEFAPGQSFAVKRGKMTPITLRFTVLPSFHINSSKPLSELLLPTELKLDPPSGVSVVTSSYDDGQLLSFPFDPDDKLSVYSGVFEIKLKVRPQPGSSSGRFRVRGLLHYQACNDRQCFAPKSLPIEFDIRITR